MALKGDLKNVQLADLFQTLTSNSQQGVLRLRWSDQEKAIYFGRQGITLLNPQISARRRLGDMLVEADVIDRATLDEALSAQAKSGQFLGEILKEMGAISDEQLQRVLTRQIEEEIYALFALESASFEFGEVAPPQGLPSSAYFRVDGIVLEAARRMDEWRVIREQIPDLNAIYLKVDEREPEDEELKHIWDRLNGTRTVLDVADSLLASPFNTAKSLIQLLESGAVRPAEPDELVEAAEQCFRNKRADRALKILRRAESVTSDQRAALLSTIARLYRQAGDGAAAARVMLRTARLVLAAGDRDQARSQLERAYRLSPEDTAVLQELADVHRDGHDRQSEIAYLQRLVEIYLSRKDDERALRALDRIHQVDPAHEMLARFYIPVCKGAGEHQKGVEFLEERLEQDEVRGDPRLMAAIYRQILELTPSRIDVSRKLKKLRTDQSRVLRRKALLVSSVITVVALIALAILYVVDLRAGVTELDRAERLITRGDLNQAIALANQVHEEHLAARARANGVIRRANQLRDEQRQLRLDELRQGVAVRMAVVWQQLDNGNLADALTRFIAAYKDYGQPDSEELFKSNMGNIRHRLETERDHILSMARVFSMPDLDRSSSSELKKVHDEYDAVFSSERKGDFLSFAQLARRESENPGPFRDDYTRLAEVGQEVVDSFGPVEENLREIRRRCVRLSDLAEMDGLYAEALKAQQDGDLAKVAELYESLLTRYGEGQLTTFFRKEMDHVTAARSAIEALDQLIADHKYVEAHDEALGILARFPNLHLEKTLLVPVALEIEPRNAHLAVSSGEVHADHLRLPAFAPITITADAESFDQESRELMADKEARVRIYLHRQAVLKVNLNEPVEAAPAPGNQVSYVGTRKGHLYAVKLDDGTLVKKYDSGSLFGIRAAPLVIGDEIYLTIGEGKLVVIDKDSFEKKLEIPLASESRAEPLVTDERIYIGTEHGELLAFERQTGKPLFQVTRKSPLRGRPALVGDQLIVAFVGGQLLRLNPISGEVVLEKRHGEGFIGSLLVQDGLVLVATERGQLLALDPTTFAPVRKATVNQLPAIGPVLLEGDVYMVAGSNVVRFAADTFQPIATYTARETLTGAPAIANDKLYVGGMLGSQFCFAKPSGELLFQSPLLKDGGQTGAVLTERGVLFVTAKGHIEILAP